MQQRGRCIDSQISVAAKKISIGRGAHCRYDRSRRNHSPSRQRKLESDAERRRRNERCRRNYSHCRIAAAVGLFPGNLCSDCQVYPLKSGITAGSSPSSARALSTPPATKPPRTPQHFENSWENPYIRGDCLSTTPNKAKATPSINPKEQPQA